MNEGELSLNGLQTLWSVVREAGGDADGEARRRLLEIYQPAVLRFLKRAMRRDDLAQDVASDFAVRFLIGTLRGADPGKGRFRDYVKGMLRHVMADVFRKKTRLVQQSPDAPEWVDPATESAEVDRQFLSSWREELLSRAWIALEAQDRTHGRHYYVVLRYRAENPEKRSPELAKDLSVQLKKPVNEAWVRQMVHRAREYFGDLLLREIADSVESTDPDVLKEELMELELLQYCIAPLERWRNREKDGGE